jgi:hypothetical protein
LNISSVMTAIKNNNLFCGVIVRTYSLILGANYNIPLLRLDRLCGLVVRVVGYRSGGPGSIPGTTRKKSSGSGTGSTQPREYY